jgi:hypothetical protein
MKKYLQLATTVSNQSYANLLLSEYALPRNERGLEDIANMFDDSDKRFGAWIVLIRDQNNAQITTPVCTMVGDYFNVLRAAFCLQPVAEMFNRHRQRVPGYVQITRIPSSFDFLDVLHRDDGQYMSFVEWAETRRENKDRLNSEYTGIDSDDADHIKGYVYGPEGYEILITECDHTDIVALRYEDFYFGEENQDEAEAIGYRCYLNMLGYYNDELLKEHFPHPFRQRRSSITY